MISGQARPWTRIGNRGPESNMSWNSALGIIIIIIVIQMDFHNDQDIHLLVDREERQV